MRAALAILMIFGSFTLGAAESAEADLDPRFKDTVRPFLTNYCIGCHSGEKPAAQFDLGKYVSLALVAQDHGHWSLVIQKLSAKQMPPQGAKQPLDDVRQKVVDWAGALLKSEARKNAGDPGLVLARRLSNAEYNATIRDLTGLDIQPTQEFPVDPANQAGFDNSGESLAMSPALVNKYLQAARDVANHMVFKPDGIAFAPHQMLADTDRDKYCVNQILDFYRKQATDLSHYFQTAWRYKHRVALGKPQATLTNMAAVYEVSPKYLATVWRFLELEKEEAGPGAKLQAMWRALPTPKGNQPDLAKAGADQMRDFVVQLRRKLMPFVPPLNAGRGGGQPFAMWRNRQYAENRVRYNSGALQVEGEPMPIQVPLPRMKGSGVNDTGGDIKPGGPAKPDPDLHVSAGQRTRYEAAFAKFSAIFPDMFYLSERGTSFPDMVTDGYDLDTGRFLSAGFLNQMGYFRDDLPLYNLILDEKGQQELDRYWRELDYIAGAAHRTFIQAHRGEVRRQTESAAPQTAAELAAQDRETTSERNVKLVEATYLARARGASPVVTEAIQYHFRKANDVMRWVEKARIAAEPIHLATMQKLAGRAFRRPLTQEERDDLAAYYRSLREKNGLNHEDAMRDLLVSVLMSPDFCYRVDLVEASGGAGPAGRSSAAQRSRALQVGRGGARAPGAAAAKFGGAIPLSDYSLASRLSYFLWSSMPDDGLLSHAAAGDLNKPEVIAAQARRMLKDDRSQALATEFAGNWLEFRRFEDHNAVDRERFPSFTNELRQAMFQEPIRFIGNVIRNDRSVLDLLYGDYTFVNAVLAKHYGMTDLKFRGNEWVRVDNAERFQRGGLLPMAVFLTKNAPGLRTSPVKRGYWVVRRVLGEEIPPPPAMVPELPRDEATLELPLPQMLAKHRENASCASCHARFDSYGLALEGYGPTGESRTKDLAGRPVHTKAEFPGGVEADGFAGVRNYIRSHRQKDFVDGLCRKMLVYALGRGLLLSDEPLVESLRTKLALNGFRIRALVENIVTSPQFLTKRSLDLDLQKGE